MTVFGVGIGSNFNAAEVNEIASDPDATYAFELTQFSELVSVLQDAIVDQACSVPADIPVSNSRNLRCSSLTANSF